MELDLYDDDLELPLFGENNLEKVLFYDCLRTNRGHLFAARHGTFNLASMDEDDVVRQFRFTKEDLPYLRLALRILQTLTTCGSVRVSGDEALTIGLRRVAYPNRLCDLEPMFGRHSSTLSVVSNRVHRHIAHTFGHLLRDLTAHSWLNPVQLDVFAEAVQNKGAPLTNCWGFIDGTARAMYRPTWHQRKFFSGNKRYHCTKYQAVMCPNGIITRLDCPYERCRHDAGILRESGLYRDLEVLMNPKSLFLYGDPAYAHRELLQHPFGGASLTGGRLHSITR